MYDSFGSEIPNFSVHLMPEIESYYCVSQNIGFFFLLSNNIIVDAETKFSDT